MTTKTKRPAKFGNTHAVLREEIKSTGLHCTIPHGKSFPRIVTTWGEIDFASRDEWDRYVRLRKKYDTISRVLYGKRSPLDSMIDKACGVTESELDLITAEFRAMAERTKER